MITQQSALVLSILFFLQYGLAQLDSLKNIGHASMKIKTASGMTVYIDPSQGTDYADSADLILITHSHNDHNNPSLVKKKPACTVITYSTAIVSGAYQTFTVGGIKIDAVAAYNANHPKASCVGYVLEFNGIKLYHAGDTGNIPEMADLASRGIDYALLPMEGVFTMTPEEATLSAGAIKAKQYIPMHTMTGSNDTVSDAIVARFNVQNKILLKNNRSIALTKGSTSITEYALPPALFFLEQNYPNPFNPATTIRYSIPSSGQTVLKVYDLLGKETAVLVNDVVSGGYHSVDWNASTLPGGIYFYRLSSGGYASTRRLALIK